MFKASRKSLSMLVAAWICVLGFSATYAKGGTVMVLRAVYSSGPSQLVGGRLTIQPNDLPQRVTFEVFMSDWPQFELVSYKADVYCTSLSNGIGADLQLPNVSCVSDSDCTAAFGVPGSSCVDNQCQPIFVDTSRANFVFPPPCNSSGGFADVSCNPSISVGDFSILGCNDPPLGYGGNIVLDIPVGAAGTYTIDLSPDSDMQAGNPPWPLEFEIWSSSVTIAPRVPPIPQANPDPDAAAAARTAGLFFAPQSAAVDPFAIRVTLTSLHHPDPPYSGGTTTDFSAFEAQHRWVGAPTEFVESSGNPTTFMAATLQCTPHYLDWTTIGLIYVIGREVVPSSTLSIVTLGSSCQGNEDTCTLVSDPLEIATGRWADVEAPFNPPSASAQPDFGDIAALVNKFRSVPGALSKVRTKLQPDIPIMNTDVDFVDISECVNAFKGKGYPFSGPLPCP